MFVTGSSTPLVRPLQPLPQFRPVSAPARTAPNFNYRPTPPAPSMMQNINNLVPGLQPPLHLHSQKSQQSIFMQNAAGIKMDFNFLNENECHTT